MPINTTSLSDEALWKLAHSVADSRSRYFDVSTVPELLGVALTIEMAQGIIDNGGIEYLLGPDLPHGVEYTDLVRSFKIINSWLCAAALEEVFQAFPGGTPSTSSDARKGFLDTIMATRRELIDHSSRVFWDASASNYAAALNLLRSNPDIFGDK